jgi:hypothetical protein
MMSTERRASVMGSLLGLNGAFFFGTIGRIL